MSTSSSGEKFSLTRRALIYLSLFFLLFFLIFSYLLNASITRTLVTSIEQQLDLQVKLLLANTEIDINDNVAVDDNIAADASESDERLQVLAVEEPRLRSIESDLYAYIFAQGLEQPVWVSPSVELSQIDESGQNAIEGLSTIIKKLDGFKLGEKQFLEHGKNFVFVYTVAFELITEGSRGDQSMREGASISRPYTLMLVDSGETYLAQKAVFQRVLFFGLAIALLVFLALQSLILRWLFRPLVDIDQELNAIEAGEQKHFIEDYPVELAPLTNRLNRFIDSERLQRERYKNTLGDLAHSIKTPLAVIRSLPEQDSIEMNKTIAEQVDRMEQIVNHQLRRSAVPVLDGQIYRTDAVSVIKKTLSSLTKLYRQKDLDIQDDLPADLYLAMPEDDLYEVIGNILDNAFKYADSKIILAVDKGANEEVFNQSQADLRLATITIKNDGKQISAEQIGQALARGKRLDEREEGQGLGLSVANNIISSYGGNLTIEPNALQTSVILRLPLA